jgi:hypothetical protein
MALRYPADYIPSLDPPPRIDQAHEHPEIWTGDINRTGSMARALVPERSSERSRTAAVRAGSWSSSTLDGSYERALPATLQSVAAPCESWNERPDE